jgi:hypothetical protein
MTGGGGRSEHGDCAESVSLPFEALGGGELVDLGEEGALGGGAARAAVAGCWTRYCNSRGCCTCHRSFRNSLK